MFEIKTLKDGLKKIAPRTKTSAITDNNNKSLDTILGEKANSTDVPSKVSQLKNDTGFITNAALANYPNNTQMNAAINSHHDSTKQDKLAAQTPYTGAGSKSKIPKITTNALGQVTNVEEVAIEAQSANLSQNLTYANDNTTPIVTYFSDDLLLNNSNATYVEARKNVNIIYNGILSTVEKAITRFSKDYFNIKNINEISLDISKVLATSLLLDGSNVSYNSVDDVNNFKTGIGSFYNVQNLPANDFYLILSASRSPIIYHQIQFAISLSGTIYIRTVRSNVVGEWENIVKDTLASYSKNFALSANQGRILNETKQDKLTFAATDFNVTNNNVALNSTKLADYLLKSDAPGYTDILTKTLAITIYATKTELNGKLDTSTANSTYVAKNDAPGYNDILTKTLANSTYETIVNVNTELSKKLDIANVVDNLTSTDTNKALSAKQGKVLNEKITAETNRAKTKENELNTKIDTSTLLLNGSQINFNPVDDLNNFKTGIGYFSDTIQNTPPSTLTHMSDATYLVISAANSSDAGVQRMQVAINVAIGLILQRAFIDGSWSNWSIYHNIANNLTTDNQWNVLSAKQGKVLNDTKQDKLVSGTNIKTINSESLLGRGNIELATKAYVDSQIRSAINDSY